MVNFEAPQGLPRRYVSTYLSIHITIVDVDLLRLQIDKIVVEFGVRGAAWAFLALPGRSSNSNIRSKHYVTTKLGLGRPRVPELPSSTMVFLWLSFLSFGFRPV